MERPFNFPILYTSHKQLVYDLLRSHILVFLPFEEVLRSRRVCKNFEKVVSEVVYPGTFDRSEMVLENGNRVRDKEVLKYVMKTLKFSTYKFGRRHKKFLEIFLFLDSAKFCHGIESLVIFLAADFSELELLSLSQLRRHRKFGKLSIAWGGINDEMKSLKSMLFIEELLKENRVEVLELHRFRVNGKMIKFFESFGERLNRLIIGFSFMSVEDLQNDKAKIEEFLSKSKVGWIDFYINVKEATDDMLKPFDEQFREILLKNQNVTRLSTIVMIVNEKNVPDINFEKYMKILKTCPHLKFLENDIFVEDHVANSITLLSEELCRHSNLEGINIAVEMNQIFYSRDVVRAIISMIERKNESLEGDRRFEFLLDVFQEDPSENQEFSINTESIFFREIRECLKRNKKVSFKLVFFSHSEEKNDFFLQAYNRLSKLFFCCE